MNQVNPKALINSKWTKVKVVSKEKHFVITAVEYDEQQNVVDCMIEAVMTNNEYSINWQELKSSQVWRTGWC